MTDTKSTSSGGVGFLGLFFIVLFCLKVGVVDSDVRGWSWWWVTAPLWVGPVALLVFGFLVLVGAGFLDLLDYLSADQRKLRKRRKELRARIAEQKKKAQLS